MAEEIVTEDSMGEEERAVGNSKAVSDKKRSDISLQREVSLIFSAVAIVLGFIAFLINEPITAFVVAVVVYVIVHYTLKIFRKIKEDIKWWIGNGVIIYFLLWLVIWTVFYNLRLFKYI